MKPSHLAALAVAMMIPAAHPANVMTLTADEDSPHQSGRDFRRHRRSKNSVKSQRQRRKDRRRAFANGNRKAFG